MNDTVFAFDVGSYHFAVVNFSLFSVSELFLFSFCLTQLHKELNSIFVYLFLKLILQKKIIQIKYLIY